MAAQSMLAQEAEISTVPYLWTAMFGKSLRYAGNKGPPTLALAGDPGVVECGGGAWMLGRGEEHPGAGS